MLRRIYTKVSPSAQTEQLGRTSANTKGKSAQRANILFGYHSTLEIGPLNRLLNKTALFHFVDELVCVGSTGRPVFWVADRKHRHHVASGHYAPLWQVILCEREQVSEITVGVCLAVLEHLDHPVRRTDRDRHADEFDVLECLA